MRDAQNVRAVLGCFRERSAYEITRATGGRLSLVVAFVAFCVGADLLLEFLLDAFGVGNVQHYAQLNLRHVLLVCCGIVCLGFAIRSIRLIVHTTLAELCDIIARMPLVHDVRALLRIAVLATLTLQTFVHVDDAQTRLQYILALVTAIALGCCCALIVHLACRRFPVAAERSVARLPRPSNPGPLSFPIDDYRRVVSPRRRRIAVLHTANRPPPYILRSPTARKCTPHSTSTLSENHERSLFHRHILASR